MQVLKYMIVQILGLAMYGKIYTCLKSEKKTANRQLGGNHTKINACKVCLKNIQLNIELMSQN